MISTVLETVRLQLYTAVKGGGEGCGGGGGGGSGGEGGELGGASGGGGLIGGGGDGSGRRGGGGRGGGAAGGGGLGNGVGGGSGGGRGEGGGGTSRGTAARAARTASSVESQHAASRARWSASASTSEALSAWCGGDPGLSGKGWG